MLLSVLIYAVYQLFYINRITGSKIVRKGVKVLVVIILTGCKQVIYQQVLF